LPIHATNTKPVIPDYDWSIFGVRVRRVSIGQESLEYQQEKCIINS
jgi:hypothetical protein